MDGWPDRRTAPPPRPQTTETATGRTTLRRPRRRRRRRARRRSPKCKSRPRFVWFSATFVGSVGMQGIVHYNARNRPCHGRRYAMSCVCALTITPQQTNREAVPTGMFFQYNTALGPPFRVLVDTNFINFSIKNKVRAYVTGLSAGLNWIESVHTLTRRWSPYTDPTNSPRAPPTIHTITAGDVQGHDGLPPRQVHPLHLGLRHGGAREARVQVHARAAVRA